MKKMLKLFSISLLLECSVAFGGLVDAVSIVVDGKPITLYEIYKLRQESGLPKDKAVEYLIKERLKDIEFERLGIEIDDFDINQEIERVAKQNGIDTLKLRAIIANKGISWEDYKKNIKQRLRQKLLYQRIVDTKIQQPSKETLKEYYQIHKYEFSTPEAIDVIQYSSPNRQALQMIMKNPMATVSEVTQQAQTIPSAKLNQQLLFLLTNTPKGEFTQIISTNGQYVTFFVQDFINPKPMPFEEVKDQIYLKWMDEKRKEVIQSHFEKMRAAANIKVLRVP